MVKVILSLAFFLSAALCVLGDSALPAPDSAEFSQKSVNAGADSLEAGKRLLLDAEHAYFPSLPRLAEAEKFLVAALKAGNLEAPFWFEKLCLMRRGKGDAERIFMAYEYSVKFGNIPAAARFFAIRKSGIYCEKNENAASELLDEMYRQKTLSAGEISHMIARAYVFYAMNDEAEVWYENAFREKTFDIAYPKLILKSNPEKAAEVARAMSAESPNATLKNQLGAILVSALASIGKNEEALRESLRYLEYDTNLEFKDSMAPLCYALAVESGMENAQGGQAWLNKMLLKIPEHKIWDAVGMVYMSGKIKTDDAEKKALFWFKKSKDAGSPIAYGRIAGIYDKSKKLRNIPLALEYYNLALETAVQTDVSEILEVRKNALRFLSSYYLYGLYEIRKNGRKALTYLEELAALKDAQALAKLYVYNAEGFIVRKDAKRAMKIYGELKALPNMENGAAEAEIASAYRYARHETYKANMPQLMAWLKRSSEQGDASSRFKLAIFLLAEGADDADVAKQVYSAANLGNIAAQAFVFVGRNSGGLFEKDNERAKLIYEVMLQLHGRARADAAISRCYERGMGTEKNLELAKHYRKENDSEIDEYFSDYL